MDKNLVLKPEKNNKLKLSRELTDREKRLLTLLVLFAVFVVFGYYGVLPGSKVFKESKNKLQSVEYVKNEYNRKSLKFNSLATYKEHLTEELKTESEEFYPMMESYEVDRLITGIAKKGGLSVTALSVSPYPSPASLTHYQFSESVTETDKYDMIGQTFTVETAEEEAARDKFDLSSEIKSKVTDISASISEAMGTDYSGILSELDTKEEEAVTVSFDGVYVNNVSLSANCSFEAYEKLIDKIYEEYPSIRIVSYEFSPEADNSKGELMINLEVYMAG